MKAEDIRKSLLKHIPLVRDEAKRRIPVAFTFHLDMEVQQSCPNCGHHLPIPQGTIEVKKAFGYSLEQQYKKKKVEKEEEVEKYAVNNEGEVEL